MRRPPNIEIPWPLVRPLGLELTTGGVEDVWEAFVVPHQEREEPPSVEMRILMAILRSVNEGLLDAEQRLESAQEIIDRLHPGLDIYDRKRLALEFYEALQKR